MSPPRLQPMKSLPLACTTNFRPSAVLTNAPLWLHMNSTISAVSKDAGWFSRSNDFQTKIPKIKIIAPMSRTPMTFPVDHFPVGDWMPSSSIKASSPSHGCLPLRRAGSRPISHAASWSADRGHRCRLWNSYKRTKKVNKNTKKSKRQSQITRQSEHP